VGKIRRGGDIFISWIGDHSPRHVHVYRDSRLVLKWDLANRCAMKGVATPSLVRLIDELIREGRL
jgi:hypothetical protein